MLEQGNPASRLVRDLRARLGVSQRALAELVGTSGPTVAAYESGTKEPRLSTLERIASAADLQLDVTIRASGRGAQARARRERRSLALAAATAAAVDRDIDKARRLGRRNVGRMRRVVEANAANVLLDEWLVVLDRGSKAIAATLLDTGLHGHDMRQMTPFAGLLSERERAAALAAADAFDAMAAVA